MVSGSLIGLSQGRSWGDHGGTTLPFKMRPVILETRTCAASLGCRHRRAAEKKGRNGIWLSVENPTFLEGLGEHQKFLKHWHDVTTSLIANQSFHTLLLILICKSSDSFLNCLSLTWTSFKMIILFQFKAWYKDVKVNTMNIFSV